MLGWGRCSIVQGVIRVVTLPNQRITEETYDRWRREFSALSQQAKRVENLERV